MRQAPTTRFWPTSKRRSSRTWKISRAWAAPFFDRGAGSVEAHAKIERLARRLGEGELREYLSGDFLLLYAFIERTVYLLSIKHHRQLSFDFERLWTEGH